MKMAYLPRSEGLQLAKCWKEAGGRPAVELAALEPTLWREGHLDIADFSTALVAGDMSVSMTTNGSRLARLAPRLAGAGLSRLRISWHTLDAGRFRSLTATGDYGVFMDGVHAAMAARLPISINRVLIRGLDTDLAAHVRFVDQHRLRLKLLDLYETTDNEHERRQHYLDPMEAVAPLLKTGRLREFRLDAPDGRRARRRFRTEHGGIIEIKVSGSARRDAAPCANCPHRENCLEGFGDYFRVTPELMGNFCYRRDDLAFPLSPILAAEDPASTLISTVATQLGTDPTPLLGRAQLRYIVTSGCNFNCGFPGSTTSWCLKQGHGFFFPPRKPEAVGADRPVTFIRQVA